MKYSPIFCELLLLLVLFQIINTQTCTPNSKIKDLVTGSKSLQIGFTNNQFFAQIQISKAYAVTYPQKIFQKAPKYFGLSINGYACQQFATFDYKLSVLFFNQTQAQITFTSKGMKWTLINIKYLVSNRVDIALGVVEFKQTLMMNQKALPLTLPQNFVKSKSQFGIFAAGFLVGISAKSQLQSYEIGITPKLNFQNQTFSANILIQAGSETTITNLVISYIIYEGQQANLFWFENSFIIDNTITSIYKEISADPLPFSSFQYNLLGLSKIRILGNHNLNFSAQLKNNNNVVYLQQDGKINEFKMVLALLSMSVDQICSPCNNYYFLDNCLDQCPPTTYPMIFSNNSKICQQCPLLLNKDVNANKTSCSCIPKYILQNGICISQTAIKNCQQPNTVLKNDKCICADEYYNISGKCVKCKLGQVYVNGSCFGIASNFGCQDLHALPNANGTCQCIEGYIKNANFECVPICQGNSKYNLINKKCECQTGFYNISGECIKCKQNSIYNAEKKICQCLGPHQIYKVDACVCQPNYHNVSGICSQCPEGYFFNGLNCQSMTCAQNQIFSNGSCVCDNKSVKNAVSGKCQPCNKGFYKNQNTQVCMKCPQYCKQCTSNEICTECQDGFKTKGGLCQQICGDGKKFILECDDGNLIDGDGCSSKCTIQPNYICTGGNSTNKDKCTLANGKTVQIKVMPGTPIFTVPGIITEFMISNLTKRYTSAQLNKIISMNFSDKNSKPEKIFINQFQNDWNRVIVYFNYLYGLPNKIFTVDFNFKFEGYVSQRISYPYDALRTGLTSSLQVVRQNLK